MKQLNLAETFFLPKAGKKTRKAVFLAEKETVVSWSRLETLIEPFYPKEGNGRPPMPLGTMLRIHFIQQWFGYPDPAMEEALHDVPLLSQFAQRDAFEDVIRNERTILRFRHLLEQHILAVAMFVKVNAVLSAVRAIVEHPFRVVKKQFRFAKVPYCGLRNNTGQVVMLFVFANLWLVRKRLLPLMGEVRP